MAPAGPSGQPWSFSTVCATVVDPDHADQYGSSSVPIYQSTTFKGLPGSEAKASQEFDYSRSGNPTRTVLQSHLSNVQGCKHSFAVATGMACLDVITRSVRPGECVIAGDDIYGGTHRLLGLLASHGGINTIHIDTTQPDILDQTVAQAVRDHKEKGAPRLAMVLLETPTNPLLKVVDIKACVAAVRKHATPEETPIVMDNTMMSPALMRPLDLGVDVVYDSATKYLSGHHDLMAGVIATNRDDLAKFFAFTINSVGNGLAPFESFLLLRGLKTLSLRINAQQSSAQRIAEHMHSLGFKTNYPGLPSHPGREIHMAQAKGAGAVISFETEDALLSQQIVGATRLWGVSVSFGCVNSLISMPCLMSHAAIDPKVRAARRLPEDLIRLCVGIEDVDDLIGDLDAALLAAGAVRKNEDGKLVRASAFSATAQGPSSSTSKSASLPLIVSAPGKVILFGEHAVVHGVTALAASVGLRFYALVEPRADGKLHLELPDLSLSHTWTIADLPWDALPANFGGIDTNPAAPKDLDAKLLRRIVHTVETQGGLNEEDRSHASCIAFLYLYMIIVGRGDEQGQNLVFRSLLPIGAGLGSSAAYSACVASALLHTAGSLQTSTTAGASISGPDADQINAYSFLSEKVIHGNPSGVDNSVAVYGGCLAFTRPNSVCNALPVGENELRRLEGVRERRFLLTDTGVARDTKRLVAGVQRQLDEEPSRVKAALEEVQQIVDEAAQLLQSRDGDAGSEARLGALIERNHELLAGLGVSHPSLEAIRSALHALSPPLSTKLTGAGGGGCAVTLVPSEDSKAAATADEAARETLPRMGMKVYSTSVGGAGVGILSAEQVAALSPAVGAEASAALVGQSGETGEVSAWSVHRAFMEASAQGLGDWLEGESVKWSRVV